jgi:hypothetical protein
LQPARARRSVVVPMQQLTMLVTPNAFCPFKKLKTYSIDRQSLGPTDAWV